MPALVLMSVAGTVGVAAWVVLSQRAGPDDGQDLGGGIPVPDVRQIGAGGAATIRITDRDEPDRTVAVISFDSQTPIGQGRYDTVQPRAWVHLADGGYVHVRADEGRFYAPDEQRPQSGVMRGNVVIKVFDATPQRPTEEAEAPVEVRLASLSFDTEYGGGWSDEPVSGRTPEGEFEVSDLRFVFNEVEGRIELLEVRRGGVLTHTPASNVLGAPASQGARGSGGPARMVATRAASPRAQDATSQGAGGAPGSARGSAPEAERDEEPVVYYAAQFRQQVVLTQGDASASGDLLEVWARVRGGRLAHDPIDGGTPPTTPGSVSSLVREAVASLAIGASERAWPPWRARAREQSAPRPGGGVPIEAGASGAGPQDVDGAPNAAHPAPSLDLASDVPAGLPPDPLVSGEPVRLTWTGGLTLRPVSSEPAELRREHLMGRMTGGEGGGVSLRDAASGADGVCASLDYGLTTRSVVASGVGETGMRLSAGGDEGATDGTERATLRAGRLEHSLDSGVGRVPGPGTLEGSGFQRVSWSRQLDFVLATSGARVVAAPREVIFQGDVRGEDEGSSFDAGFARIGFSAPDGAGRPVVSSAFLDEAVTLRGGSEERVSASTVRVEFDESGRGRPAPEWFEADGGVVATRPGERVAADHVEATLVRDESGGAEIRTLDATGSVDFSSRREDLAIVGDDLAVDVAAQRMRVLGTLERMASVSRGRTTVSGVDVRLGASPRAARVFGAGRFEHRSEGAADGAGGTGPAVRFEASWTQAMHFDDPTGRLRSVGDVEATLREGEQRVDRLSAWTVEASIDPAEVATSGAGEPVASADAGAPVAATQRGSPGAGLESVAGDPMAPAGGDRRLRTLEATGSSVESQTGERAQIESRRYGAPGADGVRALTQLMYLEGDRILVDNVGGTLDVPGAGKLLVVDRRTPDQERAVPASAMSGEGARGDALFEWSESLRVERDRSQMTMRGGVSMVHRRAGDGLVTRLEAPVLTARAMGAEGNEPGRLRAVRAEGGAWVKSDQQEVVAEIIDYDADTGILTAHSPGGGSVRVMQGASVWTAAAVRWDLPAGRIEIVDPGSLVAPR